ncbi:MULTISPECIES: SDR family oxidoreductase [unclassified Clostridium]|uniref:elongation factor P 5-aminopentanone reductase n=1 Tax=unclassified Clostridium TaxID=2614128 RepID=UPI0003358F63|nr:MULTISPECIES: SDR family oxidoreductase [unclassified Clostridium]MEE0566656.1 SDR family oxidoreductase [Clostridium sp.]CDB74494.1 short-chain dehydrogenase/reductase SDR [Clostridium sp. CAG:265]
MNLSGKVILVTGASRGIGRAIAIELASKGAAIAINYSKDDEGAKATLENVIKNGGYGKLFKKDISNYNNCRELIDEVIGTFGKLDVLVNNAGISKFGLLMDMSLEEINDLVNTNLMGAIYLSKLAINNMMRNGGNIINISSVWGEVGASCEVIYSATKGGLNLFTKALAKEVASFNIRVNSVAPGVINTEMNNVLDSEDKEVLKNEIPMMRFGEAHEVARVVSFLCEDKCKYLTGQIIRIDGGFI